jgi:hypothetical protein
MCPIFLPSVRPPFGTIEDRLSVYDCCHARGGGFMQTCSGDVQDPWVTTNGILAAVTSSCLKTPAASVEPGSANLALPRVWSRSL